MKREDVYKLIDGERNYQDKLSTRPDIPIEEELIILRTYLRKTEDTYTATFDDPKELPTMAFIRKLAGICVRCMENHETSAR